jgi:hydrogenase/urease accessory protein HupE
MTKAKTKTVAASRNLGIALFLAYNYSQELHSTKRKISYNLGFGIFAVLLFRSIMLSKAFSLFKKKK